MSKPAPYPADTRAKGWRFELDYEQIEQSSTWALAGAEGQAWLLKMWLTAWRQVPCGSLPGDEEVIAALLGMAPKQWAKHRKALMRGWWPADDGRLYHDTIGARVLEMMSKRRSDSDRQAKKRAVSAAAVGASSASLTDVSRVTPAGLTHESRVTPTGVGRESSTDHRIPTTEEIPPPTPPEVVGRPMGGLELVPDPESKPTPYGSITRALRQAGIGRCNPSNIEFRMLVDAGATADEFLAYAEVALSKNDPFAYLLSVVKGERKRAADEAPSLRHGALSAPDPMAWRKTSEGVFAKARELGLKPRSDELYHDLERRVVTAFQRAGVRQASTA